MQRLGIPYKMAAAQALEWTLSCGDLGNEGEGMTGSDVRKLHVYFTVGRQKVCWLGSRLQRGVCVRALVYLCVYTSIKQRTT